MMICSLLCSYLSFNLHLCLRYLETFLVHCSQSFNKRVLKVSTNYKNKKADIILISSHSLFTRVYIYIYIYIEGRERERERERVSCIHDIVKHV